MLPLAPEPENTVVFTLVRPATRTESPSRSVSDFCAWKVTPLAVASDGAKLQAQTRFPFVRTSESPEIVTGASQ